MAVAYYIGWPFAAGAFVTGLLAATLTTLAGPAATAADPAYQAPAVGQCFDMDAAELAAARLAIDHPALVRVYRGGRLQGGSLDGWGFLEMDYIDGPSLQDAPPDPAVLDRLRARSANE